MPSVEQDKAYEKAESEVDEAPNHIIEEVKDRSRIELDIEDACEPQAQEDLYEQKENMDANENAVEPNLSLDQPELNAANNQ